VTAEGVSGILSVPTAEVVDDGVAVFGLGRFLRRMETRAGDTIARNYTVTLGYLPGLEVTARFVDFPQLPDSHGTTNLQDRAVSAKYRVLFNNRLSAALGALDVGGQSQVNAAYYGVATYRCLPQLSVSAGTGTDRLDGLFGGVRWTPHKTVSLLGEYDTRTVNYGVELRPLKGLTLTGGLINGHAAISGSYAVPLDPRGRQTPCMPVQLARRTEEYPSPCSQAEAVRDALVAQSYENVLAGVDGSTLFVEFESRRFREQVDALGVAAAVAVSLAGPDIERVVLTPKVDDVPMLTLQANVEDLAGFFADPGTDPACIAVSSYCAGGRPPDTVYAAEGNRKNGHGEVFMRLLNGFEGARPGLATFQTKWGLGLEEHVFPGRGLRLQARQDWPILNDIETEGENTKPVNRDAWLSYMDFVSPRVLGMATAGYFGDDRYGAFTEGNYYLQPGRYKLGARYGFVLDERKLVTDKQDALALAQAGYYEPSLDWELTAMGGQFLKGDRGFFIDSRRHFGPTEITLFAYDSNATKPEAGFRIFLPLPWFAERRHGAWRLDGAPYFGYQYRSESDPWGGLAPVGVELEGMRQRLRPEYVREHLAEFRRAAQLALEPR
jgi:hypothetical protein